jgi:hypothetical protein
MLVETDRDLKIEQKFPMAVYLPGDVQPLRVKGRIASQMPATDGKLKRFNIGVEFLDLKDKDKSRLNTFFSRL